MKRSRLLFIPFFFITLILNLSSCGEDRWPEYAAETAQDEWIDSIMRKNYLWYQEIPQSKYLNYFSAPSTFLQSLLYRAQDNLYSYVDTVQIVPEPTYGYNYIIQKALDNDTAYYALVSYVLPDSPASDAGLKRGDWIMKVDGEVILRTNQAELLDSGDAMDLTIGKYEMETVEDEDGGTSTVAKVVETGETWMAAIRSVENNPIHYYTVLTTEAGIKLGYMVYSRFEDGTYANPDKYATELKEVSNYFAKENISHFVLDLRYNTGGQFESTPLLASILAPAYAVHSNGIYADLTYNDLLSYRDGPIRYNTDVLGTGSNLNITQGFVISSSSTSPAIAGTLLNCFAPLRCWGLVGSSVACRGFATERFISPQFPWAVNPVVCSVANSEGETGENGTFAPNKTVSETSNLAKFLPFGDPNEALLSAVITLIDGTGEE